MIWQKFDEANTKIADSVTKEAAKNGGMPIAGDLPDFWVYKSGNVVVSCWEPSLRERFSMLFRGRVWLTFHGTQQPPCAIDGINNIFKHNEAMK